MDVAIGEINVRAHGTRAYIPIHRHPYYAALSEWNPAIYREYIKRSSYQSSKPSGSWMGFVELVRSLYIRGLASSADDQIQIVKTRTGWNCRHGKHRACILRFLFGPHATLRIEDGRVVGVQTNSADRPLQHIRTLAFLLMHPA